MNTSKKKLIAIAAASITLAACGDTGSKGDGESGPLETMTFTITNAGESSIFTGRTAFSIYDGETKLAVAGPCSCERLCAADEAPPLSELRPGQVYGRVWDGEIVTEDACEIADVAGKTLEAEFCFGASYKGESLWDWAGEPTRVGCVRIPFKAGVDTDIKQDVESVIEPAEPFAITLENLGNTPIYVQKTFQCGFDAWYTLKHGEEEVDTSAFCLCDCAVGPCDIACANACPANATEEIVGGENISIGLSNVYQKVYESQAGQCTQHQYMPEPMTIEVCWGTESIGESEAETVVGGEIECRTEVIDMTGEPLTISVGGARL